MGRSYSAVIAAVLLLLSVCSMVPSLIGAQPVFHEDTPGPTNTTDDGTGNRDVTLDMMHFSPWASAEDGIYYVARRGVDPIAYFGESEVWYVVGDTLLRLGFPGSAGVMPVGEEETGSVTNYMFGNDPSAWRTGLRDCAVLRYSDIYPGIDLVYRFLDGSLKYEFAVMPRVDPSLIQMRYPDADTIDVNDDSVAVAMNGVVLTDSGLTVFQEDSRIVSIECAFEPRADNTLGLSVGQYDVTRELVVDPLILIHSTFLGGSGYDSGYAIAVENGFVYVTGETYSSDFPAINAYDSALSGDNDAFIAKLAVDGQSLVYSTFLGGSGYDFGYAIAVENGFVYVAGETYSSDFPAINAYDSVLTGDGDAFIAKLAVDGQSLIYSTFIGGSNREGVNGIAVENGSAYVTGYTSSSDFPTVSAYDSTLGGSSDCFVTKFAADGLSLIYSTFLGGTGAGSESGQGIAVENGSAYVTGYTQSSSFPFVNGFDFTYGGGIDGFVTKLAANGSALVYSTYLGGSAQDMAFRIAVENGFAYVTGSTDSSGFPSVNAYDSTLGGTRDCFMTRLAANGSALVYSTFLGGSGQEGGLGIALENGSAYVTGFTDSSDFPTANAYDSTYNGGGDCFVTSLASDGQSLIHSTYFGGSSDDAGYGIAVESGFAYITGCTSSTDFPIADAYDSTYAGDYDSFVAVICDGTDTDMDGLIDLVEALYGTNPLCIDSDNDNFLDGYEVAYGSDPLDPMSYPAMPQAWYDAIYHDLDGNTTLIQYLIAWSNGNATLLQSVMQQMNDNAMMLQQVVSWLDGNHSAIETLFTAVNGNATLLIQTVNALSGNSSLIQNLVGWASGNTTLLLTVVQQLDTNATLLQHVVAWLDGNHTSIEKLFSYVEGNATLLMQVVSAVDNNEAELDLLAALVTRDVAALSQFNASHIEDINEIRAVLDMLGVTVGDTDYDGLDDLDEIALGTDLQCIDTDCDNLNDAYEVKIGTDPTDDDSDTFLDGAEVLAGTDPLDALDYPGHTGTTTVPPMGIELVVIVGAAGCVGLMVLLVLMRKRTGTRAPS